VKVPAAYVIVYEPSGTLVNVKLMLPSVPHVEGLLPTATSVGADGAVIVTFTPAPEVQPPAVVDRLLYVPAGAVTVAAPPATLTFVKLPVAYAIVYKPLGTLVNVKSILPLAPQAAALLPTATSVGTDGAVIVTFTPAPEVQPPAVIDRLLYVPAGAVTVAVPPATLTPVKVPAAYVMVYDPSGTLVNVKSILPLAPQAAALLPTATSVGADGAVILTFTPAPEVQPPAVIDRLLYVPAGAVTVAVPPATLTPVKVPAAYVMVYDPLGTLVNVKLMLPSTPHVAGLLPTATSVGADGAVIVIFTPVPEVQLPVVIDRLL
jgi:phage terminase large subunit-like protein